MYVTYSEIEAIFLETNLPMLKMRYEDLCVVSIGILILGIKKETHLMIFSVVKLCVIISQIPFDYSMSVCR